MSSLKPTEGCLSTIADRRWLPVTVFCLATVFSALTAVAQESPLEAGVAEVDIAPQKFPVWVNGGFVAQQADTVKDPLRARALVLKSGETRLAIVVVDSCAMLVDLLDDAKQKIAARTGIPASHVTISSTHTHSAPSVAGLHGTPAQEDYAAQLPIWIADAVESASKKLVPAEIGWTSTECHEYIYCRRWEMKPGTANNVLFNGRTENIVQMNPGQVNPNAIRQVGPVDPIIPILSVRTIDGKPLSVLSSFSTHYAGSPALSSDYFGVVCRKLADTLRPEKPSDFVGLMANATSGDANCIDFSKPRKPFTHYEVGAHVAGKILEALPKIQYRRSVTLDALIRRMEMPVRMPPAEDVAAAKAYIAQRFPDRLPKNGDENYARETVLLSEMPPVRQFVVQVLRVGDLAIAANPCETYAETGMKIREACKLPLLMNIGLANGYSGYIPPARHFELGGYTTWRARSSCLVIEAEQRMVEGFQSLLQEIATRAAQPAGKQQDDRSKADKKAGVIDAERLRSRALSVEESLRLFESANPLNIKCIAAEPNVIDPVDAALDDAGRLWVVEMRDYPFRVSDSSPPQGAVRILTDSDSDGTFESASVFADGLDMPTGLAHWRDGIVLTVGGELVWLRDTDGDGRVDKRQVWIEGFAQQNEQLRANHPRVDLDGTWTIASGLRGGKVQVSSDVRGDSPAKIIELGSRDVRFDPRTGYVEAVTGPAQFGLTSDDVGTRMFCSNRNPCVQVVFEQSDLLGNPLAGLIPPTRDVLPFGEASQVKPLVAAWTTSNLHAGQFTAACGVLFKSVKHRTGAITDETLRGDVLVCEPTGSLVQSRPVQHKGTVWSFNEQASHDTNKEWLASRDEWFRPVNLVDMPGGGTLVVDMHRAVIEHPAWVPDELKKRPDERWGNDAGRLYWIADADQSLPLQLLRELRERPIRGRSDSELLQLLNSTDNWLRTTAARILLERDATQLRPQLEQIARDVTQSNSASRVAALRLLARFTPGPSQMLCDFLKDPDRQVVIAALRALSQTAAEELSTLPTQRGGSIAGKEPQKVCKSVIESGLSTADPWIRVEAFKAAAPWWTTLEQSDRLTTTEHLARASAVDPSDTILLIAAAGLCHGEESKFLLAWLDELTRTGVDRPELRVGTDSNRDKTLVSALRMMIASAKKTDPQAVESITGLVRYNLNAVEPVSDLSRLLCIATIGELSVPAKQKHELEDSIWIKLREIAKARNVPNSIRLASVESLGSSDRAEDRRVLELLSTETEDGALRNAALRAWSKSSAPECDHFMIGSLSSAGPALRPLLIELLSARPERFLSLADAMKRERVTAKQIGAVDLKRLVDRTSGETQKFFQSQLETILNSNRAQVVKNYAASLSTEGDKARGRQLFTKHCAACHRIDSVGSNVGPDISDSRVQTLDRLLVSILDPNRAIDNNYFRFVVLTNDGRTLDGLIAEETEDTVVIRGQNDQRQVVKRSDIERIQATGVSMMPEGFEAQIDVQSMADLLSFIKNWRY